jgi:hypothetical protein
MKYIYGFKIFKIYVMNKSILSFVVLSVVNYCYVMSYYYYID